MPSPRKLKVYRSTLFSGPRRAKPKVQALNRAVRAQVDTDHELVQALIRDTDTRAALISGMQLDESTHTVWNDFDQSSLLTELAPTHFPPWEQIGEYAKLHLLFQVALNFGGYAFTANIRPDLQAKWYAESRNPMDRVKRETREEFVRVGLGHLEYCWVMEGRTRRGSSRTPLHIHGFFVTSDPNVATQVKVALEQAISVHRGGKVAAGFALRSGKPVKVQPVYDVRDDSPRGHGRWASYISKNALRWDNRIGAKRSFVSQQATKTIRELWRLLREE